MPLPKETKEPEYLIVVNNKGYKATFDIKSNKARVCFLKSLVRKYWSYTNAQQFSISLFYDGYELHDRANFVKIPHLSELQLEVTENLNSIVFSSLHYNFQRNTRSGRFSLMIRAFFLRIGSTYLWRAIAFLFTTAFNLFKKTFPFFQYLDNHVIPPVIRFSSEKIISPIVYSPPFRYIFGGGLFNHIGSLFRFFITTPLSFIFNHTIRPLWNRRNSFLDPLGRFSLFLGRSFGNYIFEPFLYYVLEPFCITIIKPTFQISFNLIKTSYLNVIKPSALLFHRVTKNLPIFSRIYALFEYWYTGNTRFIKDENVHFDIRPIDNCILVQSDAIDSKPHYYMDKGSNYYFVFSLDPSLYHYKVVEILRNTVSIGRFFIYYQYVTTIKKGEDPFPFTNGFHFLADPELEYIGEYEEITFNFYNLGAPKKKKQPAKKQTKAQRKAARKNNYNNNNNNNNSNNDNNNENNFNDVGNNADSVDNNNNNNNNNEIKQESKEDSKMCVTSTGIDFGSVEHFSNNIQVARGVYSLEDEPYYTTTIKIYPKSMLK